NAHTSPAIGAPSSAQTQHPAAPSGLISLGNNKRTSDSSAEADGLPGTCSDRRRCAASPTQYKAGSDMGCPMDAELTSGRDRSESGDAELIANVRAGDVVHAREEHGAAVRAWAAMPASSRALLWHLLVEGDSRSTVAR